MSYSTVSVSQDDHIVDVTATGGNRRQRGAAIGSYVRSHPSLTLYHVSYSETYGFQSATYARYQKVG